MTDGAGAEEAEFLDQLKVTLSIELEQGQYVLVWQWKEQEYSLNLPADRFLFYLRGDISKQPAASGLRKNNWHQAGETLRHVADISGLSLAPVSSSDPLTAVPVADVGAPSSKTLNFVATPCFAGVVIWLVIGAPQAIWTAICAFLLMGLAMFQDKSHLRAPPSNIELIVVGLGALMPALAFGTSPKLAVLLAALFAILCLVERRSGRARDVEWIGGGLLSGLLLSWMGPPGLSAGLLIIVSIIAIRLIMPVRIGGRSAAGYIFAGLLAAIFALFAGNLALPQAVMPPGAGLGAWIVLTMATICFLCWWVHGQQFMIFPWVSFAGIAVTAGTVLSMAPNAGDAAGLTAFIFFLGFSLNRVGRAIFLSRSQRIL